MRSALLTGTLLHARNDIHARRTFRYPVYMAALDLDELPALDRDLRLFSVDRANLFSLHARDYEGGPGDRRGLATLRDGLAALRAAHGLPAPASTRLVTNLRVAGYVFNPVSFFLDYDATGALTSVIAEVNNTYGGRRRYVLGPAQRIAASGGNAAAHGRVGFRCVRELFVSPFLHGDAEYEWWFDAPRDGDRISIAMHVDACTGEADPRRATRGQRVFVATLEGRCRPLTDRALAVAAVRYPLMTLQVIGLIHLEAIKLRRLGVPYRRPGPDHRPLTSPDAILSRR